MTDLQPVPAAAACRVDVAHDADGGDATSSSSTTDSAAAAWPWCLPCTVLTVGDTERIETTQAVLAALRLPLWRVTWMVNPKERCGWRGCLHAHVRAYRARLAARPAAHDDDAELFLEDNVTTVESEPAALAAALATVTTTLAALLASGEPWDCCLLATQYWSDVPGTPTSVPGVLEKARDGVHGTNAMLVRRSGMRNFIADAARHERTSDRTHYGRTLVVTPALLQRHRALRSFATWNWDNALGVSRYLRFMRPVLRGAEWVYVTASHARVRPSAVAIGVGIVAALAVLALIVWLVARYRERAARRAWGMGTPPLSLLPLAPASDAVVVPLPPLPPHA